MASAAVFSDDDVIVDEIPDAQKHENDAEIEGQLRLLAVQDEHQEGGVGEGDAHDPYDSSPISPNSNSDSGQKKGYFSFLKTIPSFKSKKGASVKDDSIKKLSAKIAACRHSLANPEGGIKNTDHEGIRISRSVVTEIVKQARNRSTSFSRRAASAEPATCERQVGKSILSGKNLMSVTFPVRCCQPRTILECAAHQVRPTHGRPSPDPPALVPNPHDFAFRSRFPSPHISRRSCRQPPPGGRRRAGIFGAARRVVAARAAACRWSDGK